MRGRTIWKVDATFKEESDSNEKTSRKRKRFEWEFDLKENPKENRFWKSNFLKFGTD